MSADDYSYELVNGIKTPKQLVDAWMCLYRADEYYNELTLEIEKYLYNYVKKMIKSKRKINPTPALRQNLCASGVGIPLPLTDQENPGYDLIRKGWENGSQRLTRRAVETSRARIIGQIRESGYVERKGDRDVPCFFRFCRNDPRRRPPCREAVQRQSPLLRWRCGSRNDRYVPR